MSPRVEFLDNGNASFLIRKIEAIISHRRMRELENINCHEATKLTRIAPDFLLQFWEVFFKGVSSWNPQTLAEVAKYGIVNAPALDAYLPTFMSPTNNQPFVRRSGFRDLVPESVQSAMFMSEFDHREFLDFDPLEALRIQAALTLIGILRDKILQGAYRQQLRDMVNDAMAGG